MLKKFKKYLILILIQSGLSNQLKGQDISGQKTLYDEHPELLEQFNIGENKVSTPPLKQIIPGVDLNVVELSPEEAEDWNQNFSPEETEKTLQKFSKIYENKTIQTKHKYLSKYKLPYLKLDEIKNSGTKIWLIRKNSLLIDIEGQNTFQLPQDIYAEIYNSAADKNFQLIRSPNGEAHYLVSLENTVNLDKVLDLKTKPERFETYNGPPKIKDYDQFFPISFQAMIGVEQLQSSKTNLMLGADQASYFNNYSYDFSVYSRWDFPIQIGLETNLQRGLLAINNEKDAELQAVFLGPMFKFFYWRGQRFWSNFHLSFMRAFKYDIAYSEGTLAFDANYIKAGFELMLNWHYGRFSLGAFFNQYLLNLGSFQNTLAPGLDIRENNPKDISINLGHAWDFHW